MPGGVLYMDKQEYYYNGGYVTIFSEVTADPNLVVVTDGNDYGELSVVRKDQLQKKEESYYYKQAKVRAEELRMMTAKAQEQFDKLKDKLVDDSIRALQSRVKFNVAFGKGGSSGAYAMILVEQLESLIKEKAEDAVKGKDTKSLF